MLRITRHGFACAGEHLLTSAIERELYPVTKERRLASASAKLGSCRCEIHPSIFSVDKHGASPRGDSAIISHEDVPAIACRKLRKPRTRPISQVEGVAQNRSEIGSVICSYLPDGQICSSGRCGFSTAREFLPTASLLETPVVQPCADGRRFRPWVNLKKITFHTRRLIGVNDLLNSFFSSRLSKPNADRPVDYDC